MEQGGGILILNKHESQLQSNQLTCNHTCVRCSWFIIILLLYSKQQLLRIVHCTVVNLLLTVVDDKVIRKQPKANTRADWLKTVSITR